MQIFYAQNTPGGEGGYPRQVRMPWSNIRYITRFEGILAMRLSFSALRMLFVMMLFAMAPSFGRALDNGLARTPPMGWNSWNKFACKGLNERVVRETAD